MFEHVPADTLTCVRLFARVAAGTPLGILIAGLRERDSDPKAQALAEAHRRIGELNMENELLRARLEKPGPLARRRSR